jgi:hypothetical protein
VAEDAPSFAQDIRPLFRDSDVETMSFAFNLASYEAVREHAQDIYERVAEGSMPCDAPWPPDDVERFKAWIDSGSPP